MTKSVPASHRYYLTLNIFYFESKIERIMLRLCNSLRISLNYISACNKDKKAGLLERGRKHPRSVASRKPREEMPQKEQNRQRDQVVRSDPKSEALTLPGRIESRGRHWSENADKSHFRWRESGHQNGKGSGDGRYR